jgi:hypothetical protein
LQRETVTFIKRALARKDKFSVNFGISSGSKVALKEEQQVFWAHNSAALNSAKTFAYVRNSGHEAKL